MPSAQTLRKRKYDVINLAAPADHSVQSVERRRDGPIARRAHSLPKELPGAESRSVQHFDFAIELAGNSVLRDLQVVMRLKIHPELCLHAEKLAQP